MENNDIKRTPPRGDKLKTEIFDSAISIAGDEIKKDSSKSNKLKTDLLNSAISIAGGNKGGSGKSTHVRALIEGYLEAGVKPTILEGDGGNSDVAKFFGVKKSFDLNRPEGFVELFDAIEQSPVDRPVVISLPGGADEKCREHSPGFFHALADLAQAHNRPVRMHWVIDDKRDGLESLRAFRTAYPDIPTDVIKNLFFGGSAAFHLFDSSKEKAAVLERGGRVVDLPALTGRVARQILVQRLTHAQAVEKLGFLDRREFQVWWQATLANYREAGLLP